jgi:hypothetical protein
MKKILFVLVTMVMVLVGCSDQQFLDETLANKALLPAENEFNALIEQARFGDGQAFLKLADTLGGLRLMEQAASQGSNFGNLMMYIPAFHRGKAPDTAKLTELSEKMPMVNTILAELYLGDYGIDMYDDQMAAHYYLKADEHACLGRRGARWLLRYHEAGKLQSSKGKNFIPCEDTYNDEQSVMYTIMVILEKEGLPASAGGMCGPIMASTIDVLVDSYDLQPMLVREYEKPEDIIEVVDTFAAK